MAKALQFLREQPSEKPITAARIYNVNVNTLNSLIRRVRAKAKAKAKATTTSKAIHGGHNKILLEVQVEAIYKYVEDSYHAGYGASKSMVFMAIGHLKAAEIPSRPQPTWRWF